MRHDVRVVTVTALARYQHVGQKSIASLVQEYALFTCRRAASAGVVN